MNTFQIIAVPITAFFAIRSILTLARGKQPFVGSAIISGMWLAATAAILEPDLTNWAAGVLGIGRGADLVIYVVALGLMIAFFYFYRKYRRLSDDITVVVREMALREADREEAATEARRTGDPPATRPG